MGLIGNLSIILVFLAFYEAYRQHQIQEAKELEFEMTKESFNPELAADQTMEILAQMHYTEQQEVYTRQSVKARNVNMRLIKGGK